MCGRYFINEDGLPELALEFNATVPIELQEAIEWPTDDTEPTKAQRGAKFPRWNIAPTTQVPIIRWSETGELEVAMAEWWMTPRWAKEINYKYTTFNAKSEELISKPSWRASIKDRRCLVPCNGFYEWQGKKAPKTPYRVTATDQPLYAFAGLWDRATIDGKQHDSCTIITTEPSEFFTHFHHREAVILPRELRGVWMDQSIKEKGAVTSLLEILKPYPDELLQLEVVDDSIGNTRTKDNPQLKNPTICRWLNGKVETSKAG